MNPFIYFVFLAIAIPYASFAQSKNNFNPDISVNALMLYQNSNRGSDENVEPQNGATLQEAEIQFTADVDPYSKFMATFSLHPEIDTLTIPHSAEYVIDPEELFVETLQLPQLSIRAGKFKTPFGRHNQLHTHAFPFIDAPLINDVLLGEEGLNDIGISAAYLIPGMPWYSEATGQILSGRTEGPDYFNSRSPNASVYLMHLKNLWEVSEEASIELGLSGVEGKNSFQNQASLYQQGDTKFLGLDFTLKWRPLVGGKGRAIYWSTEYIDRQIDRPMSKNSGKGYATWIQYQLAPRWWAQARSEYLQVEDTDSVAPLANPPHQRKYTALVAFLPSEFSGLRLQYSNLYDGGEKPEQKFLLQFNAMIGAHPAHAY